MTDAPERIVEAAKRLFAERGFAAVGVNEIGLSAGLTGPAIYRHFSSKDEILAAIFDIAMDRLLELCGPRRADPAQDLDALVEAQIAFALREPMLLSTYVHDGRALRGDARRRITLRQRRHVERWERAVAALCPGRSPEEVRAAVHSALGLVLSVVWWPQGARRDPLLPEHLRAAVDGVLALP